MKNTSGLYLIEGLPGSGKTTFSELLAKHLRKSGTEVNLYREGDLHPADMAWCGLLTNEEFDKVCEQYATLASDIHKNCLDWRDYRIVAYTKIKNMPPELFTYFESKEIYDGRVPGELFCEVLEERWKRFGEKATGVSIFECAFLQNAVNELTLFAQMEEDKIVAFLQRLLAAVKELDPVILYLDLDVRDCIERAAATRIDQDGNRVWEQRVMEYVCTSPYGRTHALEGIDGMLDYFKIRKEREFRIVSKLPIETIFLKTNCEQQESAVSAFLTSL